MWIRMRRLEKAQVYRLLSVATLLVTLLTTLFLIAENNRVQRRSAQMADKVERVNRENARLNDCMRRNIQVSYQRGLFTDELRALADARLDNLEQLVVDASTLTDRDARRQSLEDSVADVQKIKLDQQAVRDEQDQYQYPPLDDCD